MAHKTVELALRLEVVVEVVEVVQTVPREHITQRIVEKLLRKAIKVPRVVIQELECSRFPDAGRGRTFRAESNRAERGLSILQFHEETVEVSMGILAEIVKVVLFIPQRSVQNRSEEQLVDVLVYQPQED